ncbi:MAG TPA: hypothetical protein VJT31_07240, partial [Rugosimonospora sp.]|nr:hypothetical protein [Rugosimonospora sp.]
MARFLFYTAVGSGRLYPLIRTLQRLRERGHDVLVYTEREHLGLLDFLDIPARAVDPRIEELADTYWRAGTRLEALARTAGTQVDRAVREVADLRQALRRHAPDAVVVDCSCWGAAA